MAVEAGPNGSTFVNPSALPADTATAPLGTSVPGNYRAACTGVSRAPASAEHASVRDEDFEFINPNG